MWMGGYFCEIIGLVREGIILNYVKNHRRFAPLYAAEVMYPSREPFV